MAVTFLTSPIIFAILNYIYTPVLENVQLRPLFASVVSCDVASISLASTHIFSHEIIMFGKTNPT